jgi:hypothetical protein
MAMRKSSLWLSSGTKRITDCKVLDNLAVLKIFGMEGFASRA